MYEHTPTEISEKTLELCNRIVPGSRLLFLDITADPACNPEDCFENVRQKVEKEGGRNQYGWALWEWPRVFIEAEHHAVYESSKGLHGWISRRAHEQVAADSSFQTTLPRTISMTRASGGTTLGLPFRTIPTSKISSKPRRGEVPFITSSRE
jgi:hypothetical protein